MRVILQRVKKAKVCIQPDYESNIEQGLLIFLGIESEDTQEDIHWLVRKISHMRIFADQDNKMNLSLKDTSFQAMVISQFTLHASTKKGNRPSFIKAAKPDIAQPLYEEFISELSQTLNQEIKSGIFGRDMQVELINDGPVTILIDSKEKY